MKTCRPVADPYGDWLRSVQLMADGYRRRSRFQYSAPRPLLVNPWERAILEAELGGPEAFDRFAKYYGFSGVEDYET